MQDYMKYELFEERMLHMIFGPMHGAEIIIRDDFKDKIDEVLSEVGISENERDILLRHVRGCRSLKEQSLVLEPSEDETESQLAWIVYRVCYSPMVMKLEQFIKMPGEDHIEEIIKKNPKLMDEFSIDSPDVFKDALGDHYNNEKRKALLSRLSIREQAWVNEYYLRNRRGGIDRFPNCLKVTIKWKHSFIWTKKEQDYIVNWKAEFDRIKNRVKYECTTLNGIDTKIQAFLAEEFRNDFFMTAETAQWECRKNKEESYAFDVNPVSIVCEFGMGPTCELRGNYPGYRPYDKLYEMGRHLFNQLLESLKNN